MADFEAPGSLIGSKIIHSNLTNPYYLMLKWEGSPEYSFAVENTQKSEVRPLHKFEQDISSACAVMFEADGRSWFGSKQPFWKCPKTWPRLTEKVSSENASFLLISENGMEAYSHDYTFINETR